MLTLVLLRHAKSSWDEPGLDDFKRPLNERGRKAAPEIGAQMKRLKLAPDLILCSPSKRTRATLELVQPYLPSPAPEVRFPENLYLASTRDLMAEVQNLPASVKTAMLVGHNPGLHGLAMAFAGQGDPSELARLHQKFPTAAIAVVTFRAGNWHDVSAEGGSLAAFLSPKRRT